MKKSTSIVVLVALAISVCLNIVQICVSSYRTYVYNQTENVQAGTYWEDPDYVPSSNAMALDGTDHRFYYYQTDGTVLKQGGYELQKDGTGVLYDEEDHLCGYAVTTSRKSVQVIWSDNSYTIFGGHQDGVILP